MVEYRCIAHCKQEVMNPMKYGELIGRNASEFEVREFLTDGDMTAITIRIPKNLKDAAVESAAGRGMSFSAFIRMCMMEELSKRSQE